MDCEDCEHFNSDDGDCYGEPDGFITEEEHELHEEVMNGVRPSEECPWFENVQPWVRGE